jgi:hypothetical protein
MNLDIGLSSSLPALLMAFGGLAFGVVYFLILRRTTDLLAAGRGWAGPAGLTMVRIAGAAALFIFAARLGALPLLGGFSGFLAARMIVMRSARRTV